MIQQRKTTKSRVIITRYTIHFISVISLIFHSLAFFLPILEIESVMDTFLYSYFNIHWSFIVGFFSIELMLITSLIFEFLVEYKIFKKKYIAIIISRCIGLILQLLTLRAFCYNFRLLVLRPNYINFLLGFYFLWISALSGLGSLILNVIQMRYIEKLNR